jgi:peroxiredoxin
MVTQPLFVGATRVQDAAMQADAPLAAELARTRAGRLQWEPAYDAMVAGLRASRAGSTVPGVGARLPDFALPDSEGRWTTLADLLAPGPLVLSFQRGGWCPFCRTEMAAWRAALPGLAALGARLAVVTPETGGRAAALAAQVGPGCLLLCDVDHGVAMALGLTVPLPAEIANRYREGGLDLDKLTGGAGGFVPIPATFAIARDGTLLFSYANPDFRLRAEPADVMAALSAAATPAP